jgi:hypothetical protein
MSKQKHKQTTTNLAGSLAAMASVMHQPVAVAKLGIRNETTAAELAGYNRGKEPLTFFAEIETPAWDARFTFEALSFESACAEAVNMALLHDGRVVKLEAET